LMLGMQVRVNAFLSRLSLLFGTDFQCSKSNL